jgi:3-oxoacyl-[acyl-carrier protein] reductase
VAVASVDGFNAARYHVAYGAAKAGLISMVKTFSDELGSSGTRVNAVAPGAIFAPTPDKPTPPPSELPAPLARPLPGDIANGILFLASDLAACVTGQTLAIDGGVSVESAFAFPPEMADRGRAVAKS